MLDSKAVNVNTQAQIRTCYCVDTDYLDFESDGVADSSWDLFYEASIIKGRTVALIISKDQDPFFFSPFARCADNLPAGWSTNYDVPVGAAAFISPFKILVVWVDSTASIMDTKSNSWLSTTAAPFTTTVSVSASYQGNIYALDAYGRGLYFDPTTNSWNPWPNMESRAWYSCMVVWKDCFFVFGGQGTETQVAMFNVSRNLWISLNPMPVRRSSFTCAVLPQDGDKVILVGGLDSMSSSSIFDAVSRSWTQPTATLASIRYGSSLIELAGRIFVAGGGYVGEENTVEEFHLSNNSWTILPRLTRYPFQFGMVVTAKPSAFPIFNSSSCYI